MKPQHSFFFLRYVTFYTTVSLEIPTQFIIILKFLVLTGNLSFATITVKLGGDVEFRKVTSLLRLTLDQLWIHYRGKFAMNQGEIFSSFSWIHSQGHLNLDEGGHVAEKGKGAGSSSMHAGSGAGHGGQGGSDGGAPYGSVYKPLQLGSGGGNGDGIGGNGGGQIMWIVAKRLELNGLISARGKNSSGGNAGGGSGGSIYIQTTNMTGHGEISVQGGAGSGRGGGGSGGRVAIHCRWRYTFGGKFTDRGGEGSSATYGAPAGTIYKEENLRPLQYRHLKYSKTTNSTYLAVDHTYIHVDNQGKKRYHHYYQYLYYL